MHELYLVNMQFHNGSTVIKNDLTLRPRIPSLGPLPLKIFFTIQKFKKLKNFLQKKTFKFQVFVNCHVIFNELRTPNETKKAPSFI